MQGLAQLLQVLLTAAPAALMAAPSLAMLPTSDSDRQLAALPPFAGTSAAIAAETAAALALQVSDLGCAVNARFPPGPFRIELQDLFSAVDKNATLL